MPSPVTKAASKDSWNGQDDPGTNHGNGTDIFVRSYSFGNRNQRIMIAFPITWGVDIPVGATITAATLSLYSWGGASGRTYWAYKCTRDNWIELEVTWNSYKAASAWTSPGGDYVTINPVGASIVTIASGWMNWDVLAIVQDAQTNTTNCNFFVRDENENNGSSVGQDFESRTGGSGHPPQLVITYTNPVVMLGNVTNELNSQITKATRISFNAQPYP